MRSVAMVMLIVGIHPSVLAQPVNNQIKDVTMPAPNAAALGKFGDYSVGNFTGVPDISVPIYTVQEGFLSLPISLSYHASGIKVAEMASWVGAGWSLGAGGIISRTVQGLPDEHYNGYYNKGTVLETQINQAGANPLLNLYVNRDIVNNEIDGEPDIFSFNLQGYSGKFYIDKAHNAQFIPKQDLKLDIDADLKGFTLITPDGTRYIFGRYLNTDGVTYTDAIEKTVMEGQSPSDRIVSSWYLLRIETANQKFKIDLVYDDEGYSYYNNASVKYIKTSLQGSGYNVSGTSYPVDGYHPALRTYMSGKKLIQIKSSNQTVNFVSNNIRNDLDDDQGLTPYFAKRAKSLDKIEIVSGDRCQQFDFSYSYFQDPQKAQQSFGNKLKLDSLKQKSCDGLTVIPPYIFTYEGNFLPHRLSKAIDHWGFYNGAISNETKLLNIPPTTENTYAGGTEGASDRESNGTEMKKGVLTQIKFPTGGSTSFTFEANTINKSVQQPPQLQYLLSSCASVHDNACCGNKQTGGYYTITQEDINTGKFKMNVVKPVNGSYPYGNLCSSTNNGYIYVYDPVD